MTLCDVCKDLDKIHTGESPKVDWTKLLQIELSELERSGKMEKACRICSLLYRGLIFFETNWLPLQPKQKVYCELRVTKDGLLEADITNFNEDTGGWIRILTIEFYTLRGKLSIYELILSVVANFEP